MRRKMEVNNELVDGNYSAMAMLTYGSKHTVKTIQDRIAWRTKLRKCTAQATEEWCLDRLGEIKTNL